MLNKSLIAAGIVVLMVNCVSSAPLTPTISSPSGSGMTYNKRPWVYFVVQDNSTGVNDVVCRVYNNALCRDATDIVYDRYNSSYPAEFSGIGAGTGVGVATTIRHRLQIALGPGTYYLRVYAMNKGPTGRAWTGSDVRTFVIAEPPAGVQTPITTNPITRVSASHFNDLKTCIDNERSFRGNAAFSWDASWTGGLTTSKAIKAVNMSNLRSALATPYNTATGSNPAAYTDPTPSASVRIKKTHMDELRNNLVPGQVDLLCAYNIDWKNPASWSSSAGMSWDATEGALKVVGNLHSYLSTYIPINTTKKYFLEYDIKQNPYTGLLSYSGTHSYDASYVLLPGHPGSYDYFCDCAHAIGTTYAHRLNTYIGGAGRTGESSSVGDVNKWHTGTTYARVMFLFNYNSTGQTTYIKNLRFYSQ